MEPSWLAAVAGGSLIGCAATLVWMVLGKVTGIAGICAGVLRRDLELDWRLAFLAGLMLAGALVPKLLPVQSAVVAAWSPPLVITAGLLVGVGARIANGCTSGHGICGIARTSSRSWLATSVFVLIAALVRVLANALGGAA